MLMSAATTAAVGLVLLLIATIFFVRWGRTWGSTADERAASMKGDAFFSGSAPAFVAMTRAIDIEAPAEVVWPWLAQAGRGAGWYSYDRLDNGGRSSARHLVSWIPEPMLGDATAIGYLRHLVPGRQLAWWAPGVHYPGVDVSLAVDLLLAARATGSRLVVRISADAVGPMAHPTLWIFQVIDSIMATRQLVGIKERAETCGTRAADPDRAETDDRAVYQLYQAIYASGEWAGVYGREQAEHWRRLAKDAGLID